MTVETYFCRNCAYSSESYDYWKGLVCPECRGILNFGTRPSEFQASPQVRRSHSRRRRLDRNNPHMALVKHFNDELMEMKMSEQDEFYRRKRELKHREIVHAEAYKRKTATAPVVFATFRTSVTEELHENERLFNGIEIPRTDPLETTDYQEDYDVPELDYWSDIPFGEMTNPF